MIIALCKVASLPFVPLTTPTLTIALPAVAGWFCLFHLECFRSSAWAEGQLTLSGACLLVEHMASSLSSVVVLSPAYNPCIGQRELDIHSVDRLPAGGCIAAPYRDRLLYLCAYEPRCGGQHLRQRLHSTSSVRNRSDIQDLQATAG